MKIPAFNRTQNNEFYQDNLSQVLIDGLSDNGWTLPQQSSANISTISPDMPDGCMWYDTDTNSFKVKINGVVKTVVVS